MFRVLSSAFLTCQSLSLEALGGGAAVNMLVSHLEFDAFWLASTQSSETDATGLRKWMKLFTGMILENSWLDHIESMKSMWPHTTIWNWNEIWLPFDFSAWFCNMFAFGRFFCLFWVFCLLFSPCHELHCSWVESGLCWWCAVWRYVGSAGFSNEVPTCCWQSWIFSRFWSDLSLSLDVVRSKKPFPSLKIPARLTDADLQGRTSLRFFHLSLPSSHRKCLAKGPSHDCSGPRFSSWGSLGVLGGTWWDWVEMFPETRRSGFLLLKMYCVCVSFIMEVGSLHESISVLHTLIALSDSP